VSAPPPDLRPSAVAIWDLDLPSNRNWIAYSFGIGAIVPNRCSPSQFAPDENQPLLSPPPMGSLIKKRRKRMRKKKHKKMLKATRWQRRAAGK
jgi:hypothetical protein